MARYLGGLTLLAAPPIIPQTFRVSKTLKVSQPARNEK